MRKVGYIDDEWVPHLFFFDKAGHPINRELTIPNGSPVWVSFGGGTDSTAMLLGCYEKGINIDKIVFADTGAEREETYKHVETFSRWLVEHGMPRMEIVQYTLKGGIKTTLEQECLRKKILPSLAYGFKKCSLKFKAAPQEKKANHWEAARECWKNEGRVTKFIGYDCGEIRRAKPFESQDGKYWYQYPLISWQWTRPDCLQIIERHGIKTPGKSSCFFCPAMKKREILALPCELKRRAIRIENNAMENLDTVKGLGRSFSWAELIAKPEQGDLFEEFSWTPCDCYDGG